MNAWAQQLNSLARAVVVRDKLAGLNRAQKLAAEKLDMIEQVISGGVTLASHIANETGISQGSIHSYLRVLQKSGRITSTVGRNRKRTFSISIGEAK